ncbi:hypothetical protein M5K25_003075 [Dendrobium thyrsiflorum]|uniref:Pentatricopeptide repeat-containing protein n=1 Tax=Dendrobium thyrsiflorum TaxID=117978 RepID=A0ABD0VPD5_DENTH
MLKRVERSFNFRVLFQTQEFFFKSSNLCMCFASPSFACNENAFFSSASSSGNGTSDGSPEQNPYFGALFGKMTDLGCQHHKLSGKGQSNPRTDISLDSNESGEAIEGPFHSPGRRSASEFSEMCGLDDLSETDEESDGLEDSDDSEFGVLNLFKRSTDQRESNERFQEEKDESRHPLVKETCRLLGLRHAWNPKLEAELRSLLRSLKPTQVSAVLCSQPDARLAVSYFLWADRQWRYRHSPEVYCTMLEILSKTKLSQASRRVLRLMIRRGITRKPEDFANVMVSYSRAGKLRSAMRLLNLMQKDGCSPDLIICNTAIHVLVMANRLEKALRFLHRMQSVGINPDVVTFNCLIKGFCDVHRVEDALEMIREMPFKGCPPDKISYYTVITFLCKEKRVEEVRELLEKMKNDSNLIPDQVTHNLLIHVLSKHGHSDEALGFLQESEEKCFRVDKIGYSAIIHSFCRDGRMEEAKDIVKEMITKGCLPDVVTYTAVVNGFCRIGKIDQARKLMDYMYKKGCKPNAVTYTAFLNGLCRIGGSIEAKDMLNKSEEEWWTPTAITYSVVVHGLRREGMGNPLKLRSLWRTVKVRVAPLLW